MALAEDENVAPSCDWETFQALGATAIHQEITYSSLAAVANELQIEGEPYRRALSEPPNSETIVLEVEPSLVAALAATGPERFAALGHAMQPDLNADQATSLGGRVASLAREAHASNGHVYLIEEI